ncbi:lysosomal acid glucosylceramidase-like isoform X5 [Ornithodoros turicata]|uniref:lysosomal acid glucosylceramidase-like isoform X5 n=1 Tax=Ornithodoros turicata TaxID=34597 RepID=UPI0031399911
MTSFVPTPHVSPIVYEVFITTHFRNEPCGIENQCDAHLPGDPRLRRCLYRCIWYQHQVLTFPYAGRFAQIILLRRRSLIQPGQDSNGQYRFLYTTIYLPGRSGRFQPDQVWPRPRRLQTQDTVHQESDIAGPGRSVPVRQPLERSCLDENQWFLQEYGKHDIQIWGLTTENEPTNGEIPNFPFQCMGFTPETMRDFVKLDLGPALEANGYGFLKLMILDDERYDMIRWAQTILQDTNASSFVSGIGVHWYGDFAEPWILDKTHEAFPEKFILGTEACEGFQAFVKEKVSLGNWDRAETYAFDIIQDLSHWVTGWVDWNLALNPQGGPNWVKNFVDSPIIVNATSREFYKQPMYYSLAHFTKFLPRGSLRIGLNADPGLSDRVTFVAFKTPQKAKVVIVLNRDFVPYTFIIRDEAKFFEKTINERSIQSFVWW